MLDAAGVRYFLVDWIDLPHVSDVPDNVAIDSGAYRIQKRGGTFEPHVYWDMLATRPFDFAIMPDVIGDPEATRQRWREARQYQHLKVIPVWHWGSPRAYLEEYLDQSLLVAIGGLVPHMRAKDAEMLGGLTELGERYPNRFHLLGANWLKALQTLAPLACSADTSKWLDGGRYRHLIFVHSRTGQLQQAPARVLAKTYGCGDWSRHRRNVVCARVMDQLFNHGVVLDDLE
jgi:hypothetical protein